MARYTKWLVGGSLLVIAGALTATVIATGQPPPTTVLGDYVTGDIRNFILNDKSTPVPQVIITDRAGNEVGLGDFGTKVLVVNFWATWCAPCRREMPALDRLQAALGGADLEVVAISTDRGGPEKSAAFLDDLGIKHLALYLDQTSGAARAFGVFGMPTTIVIDARGREVGRLVGPAEWDSADAVALLRRVIGLSGSSAPANNEAG